jgi:hypothetical protein
MCRVTHVDLPPEQIAKLLAEAMKGDVVKMPTGGIPRGPELNEETRTDSDSTRDALTQPQERWAQGADTHERWELNEETKQCRHGYGFDAVSSDEHWRLFGGPSQVCRETQTDTVPCVDCKMPVPVGLSRCPPCFQRAWARFRARFREQPKSRPTQSGDGLVFDP